jgi:shikimate kinase
LTEPSAHAEHQSPSAHPHLPAIIGLTGFMGSGKTTVGAALARSLRYEFTDLDRVIEARAGRTVAEIFAREGEPAFRRAEVEALRSLLGTKRVPRVIALGGGAFLQPEITGLLQDPSILTIFLDAAPEELYQRCVDSLDAAPRPLLKDLPSFKKLYAARLPFYEKADRRVATGARNVTEVVSAITALLEQQAGTSRRGVRP